MSHIDSCSSHESLATSPQLEQQQSPQPPVDDHHQHEHGAEPALPPAILLRILHLLPVSSLVRAARVSKQFKTLVYQDVIWQQKLRSVLENDTTGLDKRLSSSMRNSVTSTRQKDDTHSSAATDDELLETGQAREKFKRLYVLLISYYADFRRAHGMCFKHSRVQTEYGDQPKAYTKWLKRLQAFGVCHPLDDSRQINKSIELTCQYFESEYLLEFEVACDANNIIAMKTFAQAVILFNGGAPCIQAYCERNFLLGDHWSNPKNNIIESYDNSVLEPLKEYMAAVQKELVEQSHKISQIFPDETMDVYYLLVDRILDEPVTQYLAAMFALADGRDLLPYLQSFSVAVRSLSHTLGSVLTDATVLPRTIDRERAINLLHKLFIPFLDDYLVAEEVYVRKSSQALVDEWNHRVADLHRRRGEEADPSLLGARLTNQTRETFKRNYLLAFKRVITLPVDLVSTAATTIVTTAATTIGSPFQRSSSNLLQSLRSSESSSSLAVADAASSSSSSLPPPPPPLSPDTPQSTPPSTPKAKTTEVVAITAVTEDLAVSSPVNSQNSPQSSQQSTNDAKNGSSSNKDMKTAMDELDVMQDFLSLDTVLHLINLNKDAEHRIDQLLSIGFPGRIGDHLQKKYERVFVYLVKALGGQHIKPAFDRAIEHLSTYTPSMDSILANPSDVAPLTEFFEMVHVADVIQQMVQLYYDEEICKHIDKLDFLREANKEKKVFERILDDSVACGMDKSIQVLLAQVEYILTQEQEPDDYNPSKDMDMDLQPTKACCDAIECLRSNTSMLQGAAEKTTMDLFFSEVGRRFAEILCKHLKKFTVSEKGGFQYISDMNAYHDFIQSLRQKTVTQYFSALKSLANIYIVSSPQDVKEMALDLERYDNLLKQEEILEFAACRSDWGSAKKMVLKDMSECSVM